MAVRTFGAPDGTTWTLWEVVPDLESSPLGFGAHLPTELADGWLCFDCGTEKRRLYPVPDGWQGRSEADLWLMCRAAMTVTRGCRQPAEAETAPSTDAPRLAMAGEGEAAGV